MRCVRCLTPIEPGASACPQCGRTLARALPRTSARLARAAREERAARQQAAAALERGPCPEGCGWFGPLLARDDGATCPQCGIVRRLTSESH